MNNRTLIHVLLIASLCFSQLAASVHMVSHLHESHSQHYRNNNHESHHESHRESHHERSNDSRQGNLVAKITAGSSSSFLTTNFVGSYKRTHHQHSGTHHRAEHRVEHSSGHSNREHRTTGDHEFEHHSIEYHASVDQPAEKVNKSDSHNNLDCAIYHAYLGQSGCLSAFASGLASSTQSIADTPVTSALVATTALLDRPIRAPPSLS